MTHKAQPPAITKATDAHRAEVCVLVFVYPALKDGAILGDPAGIVSKEIMGIPKSCKSWFKPTDIINQRPSVRFASSMFPSFILMANR